MCPQCSAHTACAQEREREDMRAKIAAQKKDYADRQAAAARNRQAAEQQVFGGGVVPNVQVYDAPAAKPRKQWSPVQVCVLGYVLCVLRQCWRQQQWQAGPGTRHMLFDPC